MAESQIPRITKDGMHDILNMAYNSRDMQMFMTVMTHAQTCKDCSLLFFESMKRARNHIENELK